MRSFIASRRLSPVLEARCLAGNDRGEAAGEMERAKRTLVFGGWGELDMLKLKHFLDMEPLITRARRSVALATFRERPGEAFFQVKARMNAVVEGIRCSSYYLDVDGAAKKRLWAGYSKTKLQREKVSCCSSSSNCQAAG